MNYQVHEIFTSIQGEGIRTGALATFVRLQGCPVHCAWCDSGPNAVGANGLTKDTWGAGGRRMTAEEIIHEIDLVHAQHVIITGGEPILYDLDALLAPLKAKGYYVQLETSGYCDLKGELVPQWITWSPKENLKWDAPTELKMLAREVKWVVDTALRPDTVVTTWKWMLSNRSNNLPFVTLMPEGCPPKQPMIEKAMGMLTSVPFKHQHFWRITDRMQYRFGIR